MIGMELNFRNLRKDEIECRATLIGPMIEISLHSQAHTFTRLLNEAVGAMNWEKEYTNGNKNCIVRIWDKDKNRMISKEDCGGPLTEIDGHKGQASNGFKRVCALGWGLGIELYSQPHILLPMTDDAIDYDAKGNPVVSEKYSVQLIEYDDNKQITRCVIVNSKKVVVYDGPNENGESNVAPPTIEEEDLVIPDDADLQNSEDEFDDDLPDNTDGFDDVEECESQPTPFGEADYSQEFENEIKRTRVKKVDVLNVLGIESFEALNAVSDELIDETLRKLKAMPTRRK
jgi:hypothetical protein